MKSWEEMRRISPPFSDGINLRLVYAEKQSVHSILPENKPPDKDRLKEQLAPFIRETVQKVLKEEREYYKSRPSLAARHYGGIVPGGRPDPVYTAAVAGQVYGQLEERLRLEWLRKGRG